MNIFDFTDYREFLRELSSQEGLPRGFQASLARAAGCQASYFSQILKEKVHLTEDQALGIAEHLSFSVAETDFFLLLIRLAKAGTPKLKNYLKQTLEKAKRQQTDLSARVGAQKIVHTDQQLGQYFASWIPSAVHLLTSSKEFQKIDKIAQRLSLPEGKIKETLQLLQEMALVEKQGDQYSYKGGTMHISKDSPWQSAMQTTRRHLALRSIAVNTEDSLHFSSIFTISPAEQEEIKKLLGSYVQKSHKLIQNSGTENLCCMCLDFFTVI